MKVFVLVVLCIVLSETVEATEKLDGDASVDDCQNALTAALNSSKMFSYFCENQMNNGECFYRLIKEAIEEGKAAHGKHILKEYEFVNWFYHLDNVTTTEMLLNKCQQFDTVVHLATRYTTNHWILNYASENGAEKIVTLLVERNVDVNSLATNINRIMPLHWAARGSGRLRGDEHPKRQSFVNIAKLLIDNNANVSVKDIFGYTPLHSAAKVGGIEVAVMLIEKGADVNDKSNGGYTPLHQTGEFNKVNLTKLLIENGANVNAKNNDGITPLQFAALNGSKDVLKALIEGKAEKNAQDFSGNTALHLIVSYRNSNRSAYADIIGLLIENGADKNVKNTAGKTACDIAVENGRTLLIPILGCEA